MAILPKAIYRFNVIPIKLPMTFFTELEKIIRKFIWNHKRPRIAREILRKKKNKAGGITLPDFRQYYKATVIKTVWYWYKNRHGSMKQNREPRSKFTHFRSVNLQQRRQEYKREKDSLFSKWCWESWTAACKLIKLEYTLTPCTKINSKWLKDLNIRHDTIKLLEDSTGKTFSDINCTSVFLGQSPKAIEIKTKINKWDLNQTYKLLHSKRNHKKQTNNKKQKNEKTTYGMGENICK